jgi:phosphatidylglycerol lysyltransferase
MVSSSFKIAHATLRRFVPVVFSALFFLAGGMLLVSGALPAVPEHMKWLRTVVPISFIEVSHIIGSLTGLFLLFLARGVWLRLDAAYYGGAAFLVIGIIASLAKGFDWHEATILGISLILFLPTAKVFYRKASLFTMSFSPLWIIMIMVAIGWSLVEGFEAYRHVDYTDDLWLRFSYVKGDAPRFLRSALVISLVAFGYMMYNAFKVAVPDAIHKPSADDIEHAREIAGMSHDPVGFLALLGDKSILWSKTRKSFIMYLNTPRYWIAMGDPVGDAGEYEDLVWRFRENANLYAGYTVFYQVSDRFLPLYLDRGLILIKMGEEARINLPQFTLEGGKMENQRKTRNRFLKNGYTMRILEKDEVIANMPALKKISDDWIAAKNAREKGFSLGFFSEDYIRHTRVAVVEKDGGIIAFANLWQLDNHDHISIDLMRYGPDAPSNTMEFLFVSTILWAQEQGYKWFNLGMAPLSGMEEHELAPFWHKIGRIIYKHGEEFYNFEGLHAYKSKFSPSWYPRYLAAPPGPRIPLVLLSCAVIIAGGFKNIFR